MQLTDLATLAIVGGAVSVLVQFIKSSFSHYSPAYVRIIVVALSFLAAAIYWSLRDTTLWESFVAVLAIANTIYLFLIKPIFEE